MTTDAAPRLVVSCSQMKMRSTYFLMKTRPTVAAEVALHAQFALQMNSVNYARKPLPASLYCNRDWLRTTRLPIFRDQDR